jgi:hypothetical protein
MAKQGLVLVFDLDQTLIDTDNDWRGIMASLDDDTLTAEEFKAAIHQKIDPLLNMTLIEKVLRPASVLRQTGQVSAILMLTNNSRYNFAANVSYAIQEALESVSRFHDGSKKRHYFFFDYIMIRTHQSRNGSANPPKSINDVKNMLGRLQLPTDNLEQRTYFFDDTSDHAIRADFRSAGVEDHYITISPGNPALSGFSRGYADPTDYSPVERALAEASATVVPSTAAPVAAPNAAGGAAAAVPPPCQGTSCSVQGGGTRKKRIRRTRRVYKKKSKANKKSRRRH